MPIESSQPPDEAFAADTPAPDTDAPEGDAAIAEPKIPTRTKHADAVKAQVLGKRGFDRFPEAMLKLAFQKPCTIVMDDSATMAPHNTGERIHLTPRALNKAFERNATGWGDMVVARCMEAIGREELDKIPFPVDDIAKEFILGARRDNLPYNGLQQIHSLYETDPQLAKATVLEACLVNLSQTSFKPGVRRREIGASKPKTLAYFDAVQALVAEKAAALPPLDLTQQITVLELEGQAKQTEAAPAPKAPLNEVVIEGVTLRGADASEQARFKSALDAIPADIRKVILEAPPVFEISHTPNDDFSYKSGVFLLGSGIIDRGVIQVLGLVNALSSKAQPDPELLKMASQELCGALVHGSKLQSQRARSAKRTVHAMKACPSEAQLAYMLVGGANGLAGDSPGIALECVWDHVMSQVGITDPAYRYGTQGKWLPENPHIKLLGGTPAQNQRFQQAFAKIPDEMVAYLAASGIKFRVAQPDDPKQDGYPFDHSNKTYTLQAQVFQGHVDVQDAILCGGLVLSAPDVIATLPDPLIERCMDALVQPLLEGHSLERRAEIIRSFANIKSKELKVVRALIGGFDPSLEMGEARRELHTLLMEQLKPRIEAAHASAIVQAAPSPPAPLAPPPPAPDTPPPAAQPAAEANGTAYTINREALTAPQVEYFEHLNNMLQRTQTSERDFNKAARMGLAKQALLAFCGVGGKLMLSMFSDEEKTTCFAYHAALKDACFLHPAQLGMTDPALGSNTWVVARTTGKLNQHELTKSSEHIRKQIQAMQESRNKRLFGGRARDVSHEEGALLAAYLAENTVSNFKNVVNAFEGLNISLSGYFAEAKEANILTDEDHVPEKRFEALFGSKEQIKHSSSRILDVVHATVKIPPVVPESITNDALLSRFASGERPMNALSAFPRTSTFSGLAIHPPSLMHYLHGGICSGMQQMVNQRKPPFSKEDVDYIVGEMKQMQALLPELTLTKQEIIKKANNASPKPALPANTTNPPVITLPVSPSPALGPPPPAAFEMPGAALLRDACTASGSSMYDAEIVPLQNLIHALPDDLKTFAKALLPSGLAAVLVAHANTEPLDHPYKENREAIRSARAAFLQLFDDKAQLEALNPLRAQLERSPCYLASLMFTADRAKTAMQKARDFAQSLNDPDLSALAREGITTDLLNPLLEGQRKLECRPEANKPTAAAAPQAPTEAQPQATAGAEPALSYDTRKAEAIFNTQFHVEARIGHIARKMLSNRAYEFEIDTDMTPGHEALKLKFHAIGNKKKSKSAQEEEVVVHPVIISLNSEKIAGGFRHHGIEPDPAEIADCRIIAHSYLMQNCDHFIPHYSNVNKRGKYSIMMDDVLPDGAFFSEENPPPARPNRARTPPMREKAELKESGGLWSLAIAAKRSANDKALEFSIPLNTRDPEEAARRRGVVLSYLDQREGRRTTKRDVMEHLYEDVARQPAGSIGSQLHYPITINLYLGRNNRIEQIGPEDARSFRRRDEFCTRGSGQHFALGPPSLVRQGTNDTWHLRQSLYVNDLCFYPELNAASMIPGPNAEEAEKALTKKINEAGTQIRNRVVDMCTQDPQIALARAQRSLVGSKDNPGFLKQLSAYFKRFPKARWHMENSSGLPDTSGWGLTASLKEALKSKGVSEIGELDSFIIRALDESPKHRIEYEEQLSNDEIMFHVRAVVPAAVKGEPSQPVMKKGAPLEITVAAPKKAAETMREFLRGDLDYSRLTMLLRDRMPQYAADLHVSAKIGDTFNKNGIPTIPVTLKLVRGKRDAFEEQVLSEEKQPIYSILHIPESAGKSPVELREALSAMCEDISNQVVHAAGTYYSAVNYTLPSGSAEGQVLSAQDPRLHSGRPFRELSREFDNEKLQRVVFPQRYPDISHEAEQSWFESAIRSNLAAAVPGVHYKQVVQSDRPDTVLCGPSLHPHSNQTVIT